jgi:integrase
MVLKIPADTGARCGEVLALRWSDIDAGDEVITRSLTQTRLVLDFQKHEDA